MNRFILLLLFAVWLLASCVVATPYQPVAAGYVFGYSETILGENQAIVWFVGNGHTQPARAYEMALYRAAELTLARGYAAFSIVESRAEAPTEYSTITNSYTRQTILVSSREPRVTLRILMHKSGAGPEAALDARAIMSNIVVKRPTSPPTSLSDGGGMASGPQN